jgi:hypothetical protein
MTKARDCERNIAVRVGEVVAFSIREGDNRG